VRRRRAGGFGLVTARERRAADRFWAELLGRPNRPAVAGVAAVPSEASPQPVPVMPIPPRPRRTYPGALTRLDGIDVYQENTVPAGDRIRGAGIGFVIHRCSIGRNLDTQFAARYPATRASGLIRGSFHYYLHKNGDGGDVQGERVVTAVRRLGPGDLAPSLDFEEAAVAAGSAEPATAEAWRAELEAFLDTVETRLGRTPLIYTRRSAWESHLAKGDFRAERFAHFGDYPLWVLYYDVRFHSQPLTVKDTSGADKTVTVSFNADAPPQRSDAVFAAEANAVGDALFALAKIEYRRQAWEAADRLYGQRQRINPPAGNIPRPWATWAIFQYSQFTPGALRTQGFPNDYKIDFNVTRGGVYALRGLADLVDAAGRLGARLAFDLADEPRARVVG